MTAQRAGGRGRLQLAGQYASGVSARTLRRRLSSVSGLYSYLQARGNVAANPVPRGLPTRRERQRPRQGVPLVKVTRTLPVILSPAEVDALTTALRTHRDRAMVAAMVLGGLRRCEVLGPRLEDLRFGVPGGSSSGRASGLLAATCPQEGVFAVLPDAGGFAEPGSPQPA
jgi:integrase/recombinase XerD